MRRRVLIVLAVLATAITLRALDANPAVAQTQVVPAWAVDADPGLDGTSPAWQSIPPVVVALTAQNVSPPLGGGTVATLAVRAVHWEGRLAVMLEWGDSTPDLRTDRTEAFTDAAAVQFPAQGGVAVPSVCMGQADAAVNIWQWRADSQAGVDALPSAGYVDLYPSTEDLYYPARYVGNSMTAAGAVHNLVAGGFGTLAPADDQPLAGEGVHTGDRWTVVFTRDMDSPGDLQPSFSTDGGIDTAFAVWDGSKGQRNGIKSVSSFVQLRPTPEPPARRPVPGSGGSIAGGPWLPVLGIAVAGSILTAGWLVLRRRETT